MACGLSVPQHCVTTEETSLPAQGASLEADFLPRLCDLT